MMKRYAMVALCVVAFLAGLIYERQSQPPEQPDRPVLRLLVKAARWGLWLAAFAEPEPPQPRYHALDEGHIDHMRSL